MSINIKNLMDEGKCYEMIRGMRWPDGETACPHCSSKRIARRGKAADSLRQRYLCKDCDKQFDDLTKTIFAARHQDLKVWVLCLYFMGLNLSNKQIADELGLCASDAHGMISELRKGILDNKPKVELSGEVEFDEVYVVAGHKGNPEAVKKRPERA